MLVCRYVIFFISAIYKPIKNKFYSYLHRYLSMFICLSNLLSFALKNYNNYLDLTLIRSTELMAKCCEY